MAKPSDLPVWNETEERVTQPDVTRQQTGFVWSGTKFEKPKGEIFNWLFNNIYKWVLYFDEVLNINALTEKVTLNDNDEFLIEDSEDSNAKKKAKLSSIASLVNIELPSITGAFTATNSTNNINLTGVGGLTDLTIGDVIQISGSTSNDGEYTVEVITDSDNIIINQAHAGGTTSKSLSNEISTANVTIKILSKWFNAPIGLGQGLVNATASRSFNLSYVNNTGRTIEVKIKGDSSTDGASALDVTINGYTFTAGQNNNSSGSTVAIACFNVPNGATYSVNNVAGGVLTAWSESR